MKLFKSNIPDVKILKSNIFFDKRGFFYENYNQKKYIKLISNVKFVQDNISYSKKNILRGLHFQKKDPQSQLVTLVYGKIFDVIVDLRKSSKTYKKWIGINLDHKTKNQVYMPPGCAHGFCVISDFAIIHYKVSKLYNKKNESGIKWNDKTLNIKWPIKKPIISKKDKSFFSLDNIFK